MKKVAFRDAEITLTPSSVEADGIIEFLSSVHREFSGGVKLELAEYIITLYDTVSSLPNGYKLKSPSYVGYDKEGLGSILIEYGEDVRLLFHNYSTKFAEEAVLMEVGVRGSACIEFTCAINFVPVWVYYAIAEQMLDCFKQYE